jgi:hypothetical protein
VFVLLLDFSGFLVVYLIVGRVNDYLVKYMLLSVVRVFGLVLKAGMLQVCGCFVCSGG